MASQDSVNFFSVSSKNLINILLICFFFGLPKVPSFNMTSMSAWGSAKVPSVNMTSMPSVNMTTMPAINLTNHSSFNSTNISLDDWRFMTRWSSRNTPVIGLWLATCWPRYVAVAVLASHMIGARSWEFFLINGIFLVVSLIFNHHRSSRPGLRPSVARLLPDRWQRLVEGIGKALPGFSKMLVVATADCWLLGLTLNLIIVFTHNLVFQPGLYFIDPFTYSLGYYPLAVSKNTVIKPRCQQEANNSDQGILPPRRKNTEQEILPPSPKEE